MKNPFTFERLQNGLITSYASNKCRSKSSAKFVMRYIEKFAIPTEEKKLNDKEKVEFHGNKKKSRNEETEC